MLIFANQLLIEKSESSINLLIEQNRSKPRVFSPCSRLMIPKTRVRLIFWSIKARVRSNKTVRNRERCSKPRALFETARLCSLFAINDPENASSIHDLIEKSASSIHDLIEKSASSIEQNRSKPRALFETARLCSLFAINDPENASSIHDLIEKSASSIEQNRSKPRALFETARLCSLFAINDPENARSIKRLIEQNRSKPHAIFP